MALRVATIWVKGTVTRKVLISATHVTIVAAIIDVNKSRKNDKTANRGIYPVSENSSS